MKEPGPHPAGRPLAADSPRGANPLGFSLEFAENRAQLVVTNRELQPGLLLEKLVLEVPGVSFPFDLSGDAGQFRHHRCRLRLLAASVDAAAAGAALAGESHGPALLSDWRLELAPGVGLLAGTFKLAERAVPCTARFAAEPWQGDGIRLGFFDVRLYGWLPVPPVAVVGVLARQLERLGVRLQGASFLHWQPLAPLLRRLLPLNGWKMPDYRELRIDRVLIDGRRLGFACTRQPDELPRRFWQEEDAGRYQAAWLSQLEGSELFAEAEQALARGELDQARRILLGRSGGEPAHPYVLRRLLELSVAQPSLHEQVEDLAAEFPGPAEAQLPLLLARAAVEQHAGRLERAASWLERAGQLCRERGERLDAVLAHRQAAAWLDDDPAGRVRNLERVVSLEPDDLASVEALARSLEQAGGWYRALRTWLRLARRLDEPRRVAHCHQRMAAIFLEHFDDLERARKHLDTALVHDPDNPAALQLAATVQRRRGQPQRAIRLLQRVLEAAAESDPPLDPLPVRLELAELWQTELEQPESALAQLEAVLAVRPNHAPALMQAALLARQLERLDEAAEWYARLLELHQGGEPLPEHLVKNAALELGRLYAQRPEGAAEARAYLRQAAELDRHDIEVWHQLQQLDRAAGRYADLAEDLEQLAELQQEPELRLALVLEAARIRDRTLDQAEQAEQLYRRAWELDPGNQEAGEGLTTLLKRQGRDQELLQLLRQAAEASPEARQAAGFWAELARLHARHPEQLEQAVEAAAQVARLDAQRAGELLFLLEAARREQRPDLVERLLELLPLERLEPARAVELALERARLLQARQAPVAELIAAYQKALACDDDLLEAHRALAELYYQQRQWQPARQHLEQVLRLAGAGGLTGPARGELHRRLAEIATALGEIDQAIEQLRQLLTRHPQDQPARAQLIELLRRHERWDELAALYAQQAQQEQGETAAALHAASAAVWWERLRRGEQAAHQYELALQAAPDSPAVPARLESLQRLYMGLGEWARAARIIERRVSVSPPATQARLYLALAALSASRLNDAQAAERYWQLAYQADPNYRPAALFLARRRLAQGRHDEGLELAQQALDPGAGVAPLPTETRAELALAAARAAWELRRLEAAGQMYQHYLQAYAERGYGDVVAEAWERLELVLRQRKDHRQLARHYRTWLRTPDGQQRRRTLSRSLALLLFEHLEQPGDALELLQQLVDEDPGDQASVELLIDLLRRSRRPEQLAQLLEQQWQRPRQPETRLQRLELLADTLQFSLYEPARAAACWQQLLELGHPQALERLRVLYRQEEMFDALARLLEREADSCADPDLAAELWQELAEVAQRLVDRELEQRARERLVGLQPSTEHEDRLLELLRQRDDRTRLQQLLEQFAAEADEPERRRRLLLEFAELRLAEDELEADGLEALHQVIDIRPEPALLQRARRAYLRLERWEDAADMLERLVDCTSGEQAGQHLLELAELYHERLQAPAQAAAALEAALDHLAEIPEPERARLLLEAQRLWQQADEPARARQALERAWALDNGNQEAARLLLEHYRREQRWEAAADLLEQLAGQLPANQAAGSLAQAGTWRLELGQQELAREDAQQALLYDAGNLEANRLHALLLEAEGELIDLLEHLSGLDEKLLADEQLREVSDRCASALMEGDQPELALAACRLALRLDPERAATVLRTARLLEQLELEAEAEQMWQRLEPLAEQLEAGQRVELQLRLARQEFARGHGEAAERRLRTCLELDPGCSEARDFLHKLYQGADRFQERVALLREEAEAAASGEQRAELLATAAAILDEELGDPAAAAELYRQVVELQPERRTCWQALADIYRRLDQPRRQIQALRELAELQPHSEQSAELLRQAARLAGEQLADAELAAELWEQLQRLLEHDHEALEKLVELARQQEQWQKLDDLLARLTEIERDSSRLATLLEQRAELNATHLDAPEQACRLYEQLSNLQPEADEPLARLQQLYDRLGHHEQLAAMLERRRGLAPGDDERDELLRRLGGLRQRLGQPQAALAARQEIAPERRRADDWEQIRHLALVTGADDAWAEALLELAAGQEPPDAAAWRRAALACHRQQQMEASERCCRQLLQLDGDDAVAHRLLAGILADPHPREAAGHVRWLLGHAQLLEPGEELRWRRQLVQLLAEAESEQRIEALWQLLEADAGDTQAWQQLRELLEKAGRHAELARLYALRVEQVDDQQAVEWLGRQADALEAAGDVASACDCLRRCLEQDGPHWRERARQLLRLLEPQGQESAGERLQLLGQLLERYPDDLEAAEQAGELAWQQQDWSLAEAALKLQIERAEPGPRPGLQVRLGEVLLELERDAAARECFEAALEADPAYLLAYQRLEPLLAQAEVDQHRLAEFYRSWAEHAAGSSRRGDLLLKAARHLERAGDVSAAAQVLRQLLEQDPDRSEAMEMLAALLASAAEWDELLEVLERRGERAEQPDRRLALAFEMGQICKEHLRQPERAAEHFQRCLEIAPDHAGALEELAEIRYNKGQWQQAAELYERLAEGGLASSRFLVAFRRAELADRLDRPEAARQLYQRSLELNPTFLPARQNLVDLLERQQDWDAAATELQQLLELLEQEGFAELHQQYLLRLAEAHRRRLDFSSAAECHRRLLEAQPDNLQSLQRLRSWALARLDWDQAAELLERELELTGAEAGPEPWLLLGQLRQRRGDNAGARQALQRVAEHREAGERVLWACWQAASEEQHHPLLIQLGERLLAEFELEKERRQQVHRALAQAYQAESQPEPALRHLDWLLENGPVELAHLEEAAGLCRELEDWSRYCVLAGQALEARIARGLDPEEILDGYLRLAAIYHEHLEDIDRAAACVRRALEFHPRDRELLRRLGNLYAASFDTLGQAIEVFRELMGMDPADPQNYRYLARLEAARGDADRASCYYSGLHLLVPTDTEASRYLLRAGPSSVPRQPLAAQQWSRVLLHPQADCLLQRILALLAPHLEPLFATPAEQLAGLQPLPSQRQAELQEMLEQLERVFALRPVELRQAPGEQFRCWLENGSRPLVVVNQAALDNLNPAELRFAVARQAVLAGMGHVLTSRLRRSDLEILLALLGQLVQPQQPPLVELPATAPQYLQAMRAAIPEEVFASASELLRRWVLEPRAHDIDDWLRGARFTADRAALLMGGDLVAAVAVLARQSPATGGRDLSFVTNRALLLEKDPQILALVRFAFSADYLRLRRELGAVVRSAESS